MSFEGGGKRKRRSESIGQRKKRESIGDRPLQKVKCEM